MVTHASATFPLNVLVVDDEINVRKILALSLQRAGHNVVAVSNSDDALAEAARRAFDLAFVDLRLGPEKGLDLIPRLHTAAPWMKIVAITASSSIDLAVRSIKSGSFDYLPKPFTTAQLSGVVERVASMRRLEQSVTALQETVGRANLEVDLQTTHSPAMQRALHLARQVAATDTPVLIHGEIGTGKALLARAIHSGSRRSAKPFATISCSALTADLADAELFGNAYDSFASPTQDHPGRVTLCEGGTMYLEEVGELALPVQPKLLRLIQDGEYERAGEHVTRHADIRIIAASHDDLHQSVRDGRFREDLLYRLNVIQIEVPALRDRREDILPIAERLLAFFNRNSPHKILGFTPAAIDLLHHHPWPGNIRELRNVIERCAILTTGDWLTPECLNTSVPTVPPDPVPGSLISLEKLEELHIRRVLAAAKNLEDAAQILGINAATLWRRRKKYRI